MIRIFYHAQDFLIMIRISMMILMIIVGEIGESRECEIGEFGE